MPLLAGACLASFLSTVASAQEPTPAPSAPSSTSSSAQSPRDDSRAQYPAGLANSFVTVNVGSIGYAFSEHYAIDIRYHGADVDTPIADDRVTAGFKILF